MWALCIGALIIISITHWVYRWRYPRCDGKLPPGSMGWPLLGETLRFFTPNTTHDIAPFIKERMERYGPIFRTSLVSRPVVVSTDPDFSYFIFLKEGHLFESWYPDTFTEIFGRQNVGSLHGFMYRYLKNMVLCLFGPESLKKMLPFRRTFRWQTIKGGNIVRTPGLQFPDGFHIQLRKKDALNLEDA